MPSDERRWFLDKRDNAVDKRNHAEASLIPLNPLLFLFFHDSSSHFPAFLLPRPSCLKTTSLFARPNSRTFDLVKVENSMSGGKRFRDRFFPKKSPSASATSAATRGSSSERKGLLNSSSNNNGRNNNNSGNNPNSSASSGANYSAISSSDTDGGFSSGHDGKGGSHLNGNSRDKRFPDVDVAAGGGGVDNGKYQEGQPDALCRSRLTCVIVFSILFGSVVAFWQTGQASNIDWPFHKGLDRGLAYGGTYSVKERHLPKVNFLENYEFLNGTDSEGSGGYVYYVDKGKAEREGILAYKEGEGEEPSILMASKASKSGPRYAIRLEGKTRFQRGLFVLDLEHMPAGCGTWPAFWMVDEEAWPKNGEIDIVEGVNMQSRVKTALHTDDKCEFIYVVFW